MGRGAFLGKAIDHGGALVLILWKVPSAVQRATGLSPGYPFDAPLTARSTLR